MQSKEINEKIYLRVDKDEELFDAILKTCQKYNVKGAIFNGIGAFSKAIVGTYIPEKNDFQLHEKDGMLEMISLTGNVFVSHNKLDKHAHGLFSYLDKGNIKYFGGDLKKAYVMYTGEIVITPIADNFELTKKFNPSVGIDVWNLD